MDYSHSTNINLLGLSFSILMAFLLIVLPRRHATIPIFMLACFMTFGQRINFAGLNLYMLRLLILAGLCRIIFRKNLFPINFNSIDKFIIIWVVSNIVIFTLLRQNFAAFINRLGFAFNVLGIYFVFRFLIYDFNEIERVFRYIVFFLIIFAFVLSIEYFTQRNFFSVFGGVPQITDIRDGELRCRGSFRHPILTGTFGAIFLPLVVWLWFDEEKKRRLLSIFLFFAVTFIVIASGSSGPVATYMCGLLGLAIWPYRRNMKVIRLTVFLGLISLHFYMKAPIWFLMDRVSGLLGGGTGGYRSRIIDQAIKHFNEWWLLGTDYTVHWTERAIRADPKMSDITNMYIRQGVDGGLLTLILFIIVIVKCFLAIGNTLEKMEEQPLSKRLIVWSMGVMLFAHCVTFLSVTYFDQSIVFFYMLLALISTVSRASLFKKDNVIKVNN